MCLLCLPPNTMRTASPRLPAPSAWIAWQQAAGQAPTSPITNLPLEHTGLTENRNAKLIGSLRAAGLLSG